MLKLFENKVYLPQLSIAAHFQWCMQHTSIYFDGSLPSIFDRGMIHSLLNRSFGMCSCEVLTFPIDPLEINFPRQKCLHQKLH